MSVYHISDVAQLCSFVHNISVPSAHPIPLSKILFTLLRKGYLKTVIVEQDPENPQYKAECTLAQVNPATLRRYHFFKTLQGNTPVAEDYGGYCDLRPDATVVDAFVTLRTITSGTQDGYVFVPCKLTKQINIPLPGKTDILQARVNGFPYLEKNNKETMCAQVALLGVIQYWQATTPGSFNPVVSALDVNRLAGIEESRSGGLSAPEMMMFFKNCKQAVLLRDLSLYPVQSIRAQHVITDIYSFIESGLPVIAGVKTFGGGHVLTFVGHTFDKNSWPAMADLGYYGKHSALFHENTTWIEHFVVQDDNFGPYYFLPLSRLPDIISCIIVPLPSDKVKVMPHEAASWAVKETLYTEEFMKFLEGLPLSSENKRWYNEFLQHKKVHDDRTKTQCGDGLVLRSILKTGAGVIELYRGHEFFPLVEMLLAKRQDHWYWAVEISWPDIYCFGHSHCGMLLIDAEAPNIEMLHVPGILIGRDENGKLSYGLATKEDTPRLHMQPGVL